MQVKRIAEFSNGSILQYFWPSFSYHLSLSSLLSLFLSRRLRQVYLYVQMHLINTYARVPTEIQKHNSMIFHDFSMISNVIFKAI